MWRPESDVDFKDERQSRSYPWLAGCEDLSVRRRPDTDWIVPDLSTLSDEEFQRRLADMRREHQMTLEKCDQLGLYSRNLDEINENFRVPGLPVATLDEDYTISTENYRDYISSEDHPADFVRPNNFRATRMPPRNRKISPEPRVSLKEYKDQKIRRELNGSQNWEYTKEKYSTNWDDTDDGKYPRSSLRRSNSWSEFDRNKADKEWVYKITIPKPFKMTIRESRKANLKSRSMADWEMEQEKQRRKEEKERQKKFKAKPVPANVYMPMLENILDEKERRHQINMYNRQRELEEMQKPFGFLRREEERRLVKKDTAGAFGVVNNRMPDANFKAKPFPERIYGDEANFAMQEEEELRQIEREERAERLLRTSKLPPNMKRKRPSHRCQMSKADGGCDVKGSPKSYHHHQHHEVRDYEDLHEDIADELALRRSYKEDMREQRIYDDIERDEEILKENRWPYTNLRSNPLSRSLTDLLSASEDHVYYQNSADRLNSVRENRLMRQKQRMEMELSAYEKEELRRLEAAASRNEFAKTKARIPSASTIRKATGPKSRPPPYRPVSASRGSGLVTSVPSRLPKRDLETNDVIREIEEDLRRMK